VEHDQRGSIAVIRSILTHCHFSRKCVLADHAVVMSRFARDCLAEMKVLVHKLEVTLGPGHS
jgi:hypothetical protein